MEPAEQPSGSSPKTPAVASSPLATRLKPLSLIKLPDSVVKALVLMTVGGVMAALVIPRIDDALSGSSSAEPTLISFGGMAVATILLTALVLNAAERAGIGFSRNWVGLTLTYNALIIIVKFMLAPAALYQANRSASFTANPLLGDANGIQYYFLVAAVIGLLYIAAFWLINRVILGSKTPHSGARRQWIGGVLGVIAAMVALGIISGGLILVPPVLLLSNAVQYLGFIFGTVAVYAIIAALAAAAVVAVMTARQVKEDQATSSHPVSTASFFTLGIVLIVLYHFLWIVYMMSLVTVWPFKTYTPK